MRGSLSIHLAFSGIEAMRQRIDGNRDIGQIQRRNELGQVSMNKSDQKTPRQLPLGFASDPGYRSEDLIVSGANSAAAGLIGSWPAWPSPVVVLAGPTGSGKTHIASAWQARSAAQRIEAYCIGEPDLSESRAVLVEDADRPDLDELGLFHLINTVRESEGTLLLTARFFPAAWPVSLDDLASRLNAATVVEIAEPDDALLVGVVTKLFADRQIEIEPHIVSYLVHRMDRSLATAIVVVDLIDRLSLEKKHRVSRALAGEALALMEQGQGELDL